MKWLFFMNIKAHLFVVEKMQFLYQLQSDTVKMGQGSKLATTASAHIKRWHSIII